MGLRNDAPAPPGRPLESPPAFPICLEMVMAKMFYTLEEAAEKLGKSEDEVRQMAETGQLQEFRDRDRLMFKVEQVDLLTGGGDEEEDIIQLAESGELEPISLASSGTGSGSGSMSPGESPKEQTGISIFDADEDEADAAAQTQITDSPIGAGDFGFDAGASGSGLLDLAQESDDTSLGADLLSDLSGFGDTPADSGSAPSEEGGLFEPTGAESDVGASAQAAAPAMAFQEVYDGAGSGLVGGAALAVVLACSLSLIVTILGLISLGAAGAGGSGLIEQLGSQFMMIGGGLALALIVLTLVGWVLGKRS